MMATYAVSKLQNADGSVGMHWTKVDTDQVAASQGILFTEFSSWDWYYVLNMIYSDYYSVVGSDVNMYVALAKAWIMDVDAPKGKAFLYWSAMR